MFPGRNGLGANKGLHWTRVPTLAQEKQIDQNVVAEWEGKAKERRWSGRGGVGSTRAKEINDGVVRYFLAP
jgi:hypothetical protein